MKPFIFRYIKFLSPLNIPCSVVTEEVSKFNCNDICFQKKDIKMDLKNKVCVENCNGIESNYEYKIFCNNKCPSNTYPIEHNFLCLDKKPEGYYLDIDN